MSVGALYVQTLDGGQRVWHYGDRTEPRPLDGKHGDLAHCYGDGAHAVFKKQGASWGAGAINAGPVGPAGPGVGRPGPATTQLYVQPDYINSTTTNGAITPGLLSVTPFIVGPSGLVADNFVVGLGSTPQAGGAAAAFVALYGDDGTNGVTPDWDVIASGSPVLTGAAGNKLLAAALDLDPGIYHLAFLYVVTNATGHTQPTMTTINGGTGRHASPNLAGLVRGFTAAAVAALPSGGVGPALAPTVSNIPLVALRSA